MDALLRCAVAVSVSRETAYLPAHVLAAELAGVIQMPRGDGWMEGRAAMVCVDMMWGEFRTRSDGLGRLGCSSGGDGRVVADWGCFTLGVSDIALSCG